MTIRSAMERLSGDRATENTVRDVLELLRINPDRTLTATDVARRLERPENTVDLILSELARAFVLKKDGSSYRYDNDPVNNLDVDRFMRRTDSHNAFVQSNVAKFRDRYGFR